MTYIVNTFDRNSISEIEMMLCLGPKWENRFLVLAVQVNSKMLVDFRLLLFIFRFLVHGLLNLLIFSFCMNVLIEYHWPPLNIKLAISLIDLNHAMSQPSILNLKSRTYKETLNWFWVYNCEILPNLQY